MLLQEALCGFLCLGRDPHHGGSHLGDLLTKPLFRWNACPDRNQTIQMILQSLVFGQDLLRLEP